MANLNQPSINHALAGQLLQKIHGIIDTQLIFVAAKLKIADFLEDGPMSIVKLAEATDTHPHRLYRIMRGLASQGIFAEKDDQLFSLTPLAKLLQTDIDGSLRDVAVWFGCEWHVDAWSHILASVEKEESSFSAAHGMEVFDYLQQHPADAITFNNAMVSVSNQHSISICEAYDFSAFSNIIDVGGGNGLMLAAILKRYPLLKGILFELPSTLEGAKELVKAEGVTDRCQIIEGSFLNSIPQGGDAYILKYIIHDWNDDIAKSILDNCRKAMAPGSKLLVIEAVIQPENSFFKGSKLMDIEMQVLTSGGRERTEAEFDDLFSQAGFKLNRIVPVKFDLKIIEGTPV